MPGIGEQQWTGSLRSTKGAKESEGETGMARA